ncbi:unnamed protein product [Peronospora belbahrii]|uniref:Uncharacterized protein n=1 Tax=Peronospora belbahrii TaxID=622444 RepID=A0AAU9KZ89_9STRA|nr:unnamed protein product [Peronospora belbahrii]CAH0519699.1 unnamed protein product [Peronospora belbahrii]
MHCTSRNVTNAAVFTPEFPSRSSKRDAILAAILAQNMKKYAVKTGTKRNCPVFAAPVKQRVCRPDDEIQALQQDVEELEARLAAAQRCKKAHTKTHAIMNRLDSILQPCQKQTDQGVTTEFLDLSSCGQREYEPMVDAPVYRLMEKSVVDQYDHLAQVFRDAGLEDHETDLHDARVVTGGQQGTFVRFTTAKLVPFALDAISRAIWKTTRKSSALNMEAIESTIEGGDDSVMHVKRVCLLHDDATGCAGIPVLMRGVCRRFVEPHRIVVVWEGTGDWPKDYLQCNPSSVPIRERGYCVVQNFTSGNNNNGSASPLSLLQICVCMTPGLSADIDTSEPECLQMLSNVVIPSYRKILDAREQTLENCILDEMVHCKISGSASERTRLTIA